MTAHRHRPFKDAAGTIRCETCTLTVIRPAGMPDYSRAVMGRW